MQITFLYLVFTSLDDTCPLRDENNECYGHTENTMVRLQRKATVQKAVAFYMRRMWTTKSRDWISVSGHVNEQLGVSVSLFLKQSQCHCH